MYVVSFTAKSLRLNENNGARQHGGVVGRAWRALVSCFTTSCVPGEARPHGQAGFRLGSASSTRMDDTSTEAEAAICQGLLSLSPSDL